MRQRSLLPSPRRHGYAGAIDKPTASGELLSAWQAEALALLTAERNALAEAGKLIGYGAPIAGAAGALGVATDEPVWLYGLPPVLWLLILYSLQILGDGAAMSAARARLEQRLAQALGEPALLYANVVAPQRSFKKDKAQWFSVGAFGLVLVIVTVACWWWPDPGDAAHAGEALGASIGLTVVAMLGVGFAARTLLAMPERVNDAYSEFNESCERQVADNRTSPSP